MRINITKESLLAGIQAVSGVITSKNTLPILSNFLIETAKDGIRITATDLDIGITATAGAIIEEQGATTVLAKRFGEIIKELPDGAIKITAKKNNTITIEAGATSFKILTVPKDEFPQLPKPNTTKEVVLNQADLRQMLTKTVFAMSKDETRYILNGACFIITNKEIKIVATDGRRLAIIKKPYKTDTTQEEKYIIPTKTTQELLKNLGEEREIKISFSKNQATFILNNLCIISRLIEGEFPDYKQAIPKKEENRLKAARSALIPAIKRASLLTTPESQAIKLHLSKNRLVVSKATPEVGETKEEISASYKGSEMVIGFNPSYLLDVLKNIEEEEIELELTGPEKPGVLRTDKEEYIYIVLPMQIT